MKKITNSEKEQLNQTNNKKVIDADNMRIKETFDAKNTDVVLEKYKAMNKWNDVSVDIDGDIILWEDL